MDGVMDERMEGRRDGVVGAGRGKEAWNCAAMGSVHGSYTGTMHSGQELTLESDWRGWNPEDIEWSDLSPAFLIYKLGLGAVPLSEGNCEE